MQLAIIVNLKNENIKRRLILGGQQWLAEKEEVEREVLVRRKDNCS
jgi:hypothetical protein